MYACIHSQSVFVCLSVSMDIKDETEAVGERDPVGHEHKRVQLEHQWIHDAYPWVMRDNQVLRRLRMATLCFYREEPLSLWRATQAGGSIELTAPGEAMARLMHELGPAQHAILVLQVQCQNAEMEGAPPLSPPLEVQLVSKKPTLDPNQAAFHSDMPEMEWLTRSTVCLPDGKKVAMLLDSGRSGVGAYKNLYQAPVGNLAIQPVLLDMYRFGWTSLYRSKDIADHVRLVVPMSSRAHSRDPFADFAVDAYCRKNNTQLSGIPWVAADGDGDMDMGDAGDAPGPPPDGVEASGGATKYLQLSRATVAQWQEQFLRYLRAHTPFLVYEMAADNPLTLRLTPLRTGDWNRGIDAQVLQMGKLAPRDRMIRVRVDLHLVFLVIPRGDARPVPL